MKKIFLLLIVIPILLAAQENKDIWGPLRYFEGSWKGHDTGRAGVGEGYRAYEFIMNGTFFYCQNTSTFGPQEKNPKGEIHENWTFFSYDKGRKEFIVRQFNGEGFVNQFVADSISTDGRFFRFISESSENAPPGLRARLTYIIKDKDHFEESFEIAMPKSDFSEWLKNYWTRQ